MKNYSDKFAILGQISFEADRLRPCLHYTGSIIRAPRKPYRIGLLFTLDLTGPARFL